MPVSQHDVDELRREGEALDLDASEHVLRTLPEIVGFLAYRLRMEGESDDQVADAVELLARAARLDQQELRTCRNVLARLRYPEVILKRMTMVARKARPTPRRRWAKRKGGTTLPSPAPVRPTSEAELALNMLRPRRRGGR